MLSRTQKRIVIGGVYVLILAVIVGGTLYFKYRPTCNDGIQNGQEEGVDCGTLACGKACPLPVQALIIQSTKTVATSGIDVAVKVYNPNVEYGVIAGTYDLIFHNTIGEELKRISDINFYMLPGQTKYLVQTAISGLEVDAVATAEIKSVEWEKVTSAQDNSFITSREALTPGYNKTTYEAVITNNSNFDFDTVDIAVIVFDNAGNLVTTSTTNLQTFLSRTDRSIKISWPFNLHSDDDIQIEVGTNIFNNANFLKRNGTQEKFQQYY